MDAAAAYGAHRKEQVVSAPVVLLWKARWLEAIYDLAQSLGERDDLSRQVFEICQRAIVGLPGYASWDVARAILGRSQASLRRLAGKQASHWGYFPLAELLRSERGFLRTTWLPLSDPVSWWECLPMLIERDEVGLWMAWNAWGRLPLPVDLSGWHRRFTEASEVKGRDLPPDSGLNLARASTLKIWEAPPVAVRVLRNRTGYFASAVLDGRDVVRLAWNRWVLDECRRAS